MSPRMRILAATILRSSSGQELLSTSRQSQLAKGSVSTLKWRRQISILRMQTTWRKSVSTPAKRWILSIIERATAFLKRLKISSRSKESVRRRLRKWRTKSRSRDSFYLVSLVCHRIGIFFFLTVFLPSSPPSFSISVFLSQREETLPFSSLFASWIFASFSFSKRKRSLRNHHRNHHPEQRELLPALQ